MPQESLLWPSHPTEIPYILVSPEPPSCHVHTGPSGPAMRRQYDLHPKEPNKRPMHVPTTTFHPPKRDYIRFVY
jgi:hypothetical protein